MIRDRITRRRAIVLIGATLGFPLSACGADDPGWARGFSTGHGAAADSGALELRNVLVIAEVGGLGTVLATIFNKSHTDDALLAVDVLNGEGTLRPSTVSLPAGEHAVLGVDSSLTEDPATAQLRGDVVKPGYFVQLTFVFRRAAPARVEALVMARQGPYANVPRPADLRL